MRMPFRSITIVLWATLASAMVVPPAVSAQSLGTFTWQLQPFCNRVTVNVTQNGGVYTLDGFDDQCGAPQRAPLVGLATPNPDGTIGFGFHIATSPGGKTVSVEARVSLGTFGGPWTDSGRNSGTLVLNGSAAGEARPVPTSAPPWGTFIDAPASATFPGLVLRRSTPPGETDAPGLLISWGPPASFPPIVPSAIFATSAGKNAILGATDSMAGVVGSATSGTGVGGLTFTGDGVLGQSLGTGTALHGKTSSGIAVLAETDSGSTALEIRTGSIKVSGTIRPAFQHTAAIANIAGNLTRLDHPLLNGDPNAMVFVDHLYQSPSSTDYIAGGVGVYYDGTLARWTIYRENTIAMPVGAKFNVLVIKQ